MERPSVEFISKEQILRKIRTKRGKIVLFGLLWCTYEVDLFKDCSERSLYNLSLCLPKEGTDVIDYSWQQGGPSCLWHTETSINAT